MSLAAKKSNFTNRLLEWFAGTHRPMPWKGIKNPYFIWLSEIILQQTRVEQGLPYYEHFVEKYPTVFDLANATEDEVIKSWEGLGYYSRARNLHTAAKQIAFERDGNFPDTHEEIKKLKGVGPYTAAAIASFAFDLPHAVVDGNVYRVLSRNFGIATPIDSTVGKKEFAKLADELLDKEAPGVYNQALMDFGATHCTPRNPECISCPFQKTCTGNLEDRISTLPVKSKKLTKKHRFFNYLVLRVEDQVLLHKRTEKDIWANLYDFPMLETAQLLDRLELETQANAQGLLPKGPTFVKFSKPFQQTLSHQKINARFWEYEVKSFDFIEKDDFIFVQKDKLNNFAFPKIIDWYLTDNSLYLELF